MEVLLLLAGIVAVGISLTFLGVEMARRVHSTEMQLLGILLAIAVPLGLLLFFLWSWWEIARN